MNKANFLTNKNIKNNKYKIYVILMMFLATILFTSLVYAESNIDNLNDDLNNSDNITKIYDVDYYKNRSLDIRYENLICKMDFVIGQIDIIYKYTNKSNISDNIIVNLLNDKQILIEDKEDLKDIYEERNLTLFNNFIRDVLNPDFNKTRYDLAKFKENYKMYIPQENISSFRNELKILKDDYDLCKNSKYKDMSKLMNNYYKHNAKMWDQIIKSMKQRNLTTDEIEEVRETLLVRLKSLEDAINSGNQTAIAEQLRLMNEEHFRLWTKFHSGLLNSYLNRIEPAANKYGKSDDIKRLRDELKRYDDLKDDDKYKVRYELKKNADEMKNISKEILKEKKKSDNKNNGRENRR